MRAACCICADCSSPVWQSLCGNPKCILLACLPVDTDLLLAANEMRRLVQMLMSLVHPASGHQHCLCCCVRLCLVWCLPLAVTGWHLHHFPLLQTSCFCVVVIAKIGMKLFSLDQNTSMRVIISGPQTGTCSQLFVPESRARHVVMNACLILPL